MKATGPRLRAVLLWGLLLSLATLSRSARSVCESSFAQLTLVGSDDVLPGSLIGRFAEPSYTGELTELYSTDSGFRLRLEVEQ